VRKRKLAKPAVRQHRSHCLLLSTSRDPLEIMDWSSYNSIPMNVICLRHDDKVCKFQSLYQDQQGKVIASLAEL
jgi:hypothetical protein